MLTAITRGVSESLAHGELTFRERSAIDVSLARRQHEGYERALASLGVRIDHLPARMRMADAVFVEDVAIVLDEIAIVTAPGAASRRAETESIAHAVARYRPVHHLAAPATLDGGNVVRIGSHALRRALQPHERGGHRPARRARVTTRLHRDCGAGGGRAASQDRVYICRPRNAPGQSRVGAHCCVSRRRSASRRRTTSRGARACSRSATRS